MCLCFDLYDTDHNGEISLPEADFMVEDIFGPAWASKEEAKEIHAWLHERDEAVLGHPQLDVDAWATFVAANLQIQAPAIHTRLILQTKVFVLCEFDTKVSRIVLKKAYSFGPSNKNANLLQGSQIHFWEHDYMVWFDKPC